MAVCYFVEVSAAACSCFLVAWSLPDPGFAFAHRAPDLRSPIAASWLHSGRRRSTHRVSAAACCSAIFIDTPSKRKRKETGGSRLRAETGTFAPGPAPNRAQNDRKARQRPKRVQGWKYRTHERRPVPTFLRWRIADRAPSCSSCCSLVTLLPQLRLLIEAGNPTHDPAKKPLLSKGRGTGLRQVAVVACPTRCVFGSRNPARLDPPPSGSSFICHNPALSS